MMGQRSVFAGVGQGSAGSRVVRRSLVRMVVLAPIAMFAVAGAVTLLGGLSDQNGSTQHLAVSNGEIRVGS